jgi:hypothetical protein
MGFLKTPEAARKLEVSYTDLYGLIRYGKLSPLPGKDSSGDFIWLPDDLARARKIINSKSRKPEVATA